MSYKNTLRTILAVFLLAGLAASLQAQSLAPLGASDLAATELVRLPADKGLVPGVSRDAVDFSYALDATYSWNGEGSLEAPQPFVAESREYFVDVDASALNAGVTVYTTAPGALLRINPVAGEKTSAVIDVNGLTVKGPAGIEYGAGEAFERIVSAEQLKATGVPFAEGTVAFRLAPAVGAGALTIAAPGLETDGRFTLHVFDRQSPIALEMGADRLDYLHGDRLTVRASFAGGAVELAEVEGFVTSPAGQAWPLDVASENGGLVGSLSLDALGATAPGLWEVHLAARGMVDGLEVVRSVRTSFAAHLPTARLAGVERVKVENGLALRFGVEVGTPGRYEVRGVLYGTNGAGELAPMAIGHAADWLDATGALVLGFPAVDGFSAPYELRDLRLLDQGRMGVLHRQERALRLGR